jgi:glycosyltransferase involved in cell wall biosynthesis
VDSSLLTIVHSDAPHLRERVEVVPNFADFSPDEVATAQEEESTKLDSMRAAKDSAQTTVLIPRNLSLSKGGAWLAEIAALVTKREAVDCHFFLAGVPVPVHGRADKFATNLARDTGRAASSVRARLTVMGGLPHSLMPSALALADIVLFPTFFYEGCSLATLEAMLFGKAIVATRVGGFTDILWDRVNGLLVHPNAESIASAVAELAANATLREVLGLQAREDALVRFTLQAWRERAGRFIKSVGWA